MRLSTCASTIACVVLYVHVCTATYHFYMRDNEANRLLGLPAELYYVRDGVQNRHMINHVIMMPPQVNQMHFSWQSTSGRNLPYTLDYKLSNAALFRMPSVNVSNVGMVTTSGETFSITLTCDNESGSALFTLIVNVTVNRLTHAHSTFSVVRKKSCAKHDIYSSYPILLHAQSESSGLFGAIPVNVVFLANVTPLLVLGVMTLLLCTYYIRNNKRATSVSEVAINNVDYEQDVNARARTNIQLQQNMFTDSLRRTTLKRLPHHQALTEEQSLQLKERIRSITIDTSLVKLNDVWMEGTFGKIFVGTRADARGSRDVLIKTVSDQASNTQISLLIIESMALFNMSHANILRVTGVCVNGQTPPYMIFDYDNYTNLKKYLHKCKTCADAPKTLTTQEVIEMVLQVVNAMQYLHVNMIVHKDLAARNCVVNERLQIKITDTALARDLFPADYHCLGDNENRPIKWLAIESLKYNIFVFQSDVWAFGVLLWEFMTLGQQPYVEIDPFEMEAYLKDGYRLAQPVNCPDELFALMAYCWALKTEERPSFKQLQICLTDFQTQLNKYV